MIATQFSLELIDLRKSYGTKEAVAGVNLALSSGSICAVLGRNGAGKTTTIQMIMGMIHPTDGEIRILGENVRLPESHEVWRRVGYLPDEPILYDHLTGREFLHFIGELYGAPKSTLDSLQNHLHRLGLVAHIDTKIRTCSLGTKKKIAFLAATLHDPDVLVLDEPTGSLDAVSVREIRRTLLELKDRGKLVLFSTHVMDEAEKLADRISILHHGTLRFDGSQEELRKQHGKEDDEPLEEIFIRLTHETGEELAPSHLQGIPSRREDR